MSKVQSEKSKKFVKKATKQPTKNIIKSIVINKMRIKTLCCKYDPQWDDFNDYLITITNLFLVI